MMMNENSIASSQENRDMNLSPVAYNG